MALNDGRKNKIKMKDRNMSIKERKRNFLDKIMIVKKDSYF
jgi:hypothetical protein